MITHETIQSIRRYGDFEILFQYINEQPAMLLRAHRFLNARRRAWAITLDSAWKYVDTETGDHSEYTVMASGAIANMLGLGNDIRTRFRIAEAIVDNLEELINMKPYRRPDNAVAADIVGKMTVGGKTFEIEAQADQPINPIPEASNG